MLRGITAQRVDLFDRRCKDGLSLSDHIGVSANLAIPQPVDIATHAAAISCARSASAESSASSSANSSAVASTERAVLQHVQHSSLQSSEATHSAAQQLGMVADETLSIVGQGAMR